MESKQNNGDLHSIVETVETQYSSEASNSGMESVSHQSDLKESESQLEKPAQGDSSDICVTENSSKATDSISTPSSYTGKNESQSIQTRLDISIAIKGNMIEIEQSIDNEKDQHVQETKVNVDDNNKINEDDDRYGLSGMLKVVRMSDLNLNVLALGTDLTTLGLNLNEKESLYSSFISPLLNEQPVKDDIEFYLPPSYYMSPPPLKISHLQKFTLETLLYMFYTIVGGTLQGYAAVELYNRGWVYHTQYKKWFIKVMTPQSQSTVNSLLSTNLKDHNVKDQTTGWIYFEPTVWEKRFYSGNINYQLLFNPESLRDLVDDTSDPISTQTPIPSQHGMLLTSTGRPLSTVPNKQDTYGLDDTSCDIEGQQSISGASNRPPGFPPGPTTNHSATFMESIQNAVEVLLARQQMKPINANHPPNGVLPETRSSQLQDQFDLTLLHNSLTASRSRIDPNHTL